MRGVLRGQAWCVQCRRLDQQTSIRSPVYVPLYCAFATAGWTLFVAAVGSARLAPHIHRDVVRHWFCIINNFPRIDSLLRAVAPPAPVCVACGGNWLLSLPAVTIILSSRTSPTFTKVFGWTLCTGVLWCLTCVAFPIFLGSVSRRWPSFSNTCFASSTISRLRARAAGLALTAISTSPPRLVVISATCFVMYCYECCS